MVITLGFILFNVVPTYTTDPGEVTEGTYQSVATAETVQVDKETELDWQQDEHKEKCGQGEPCTTVCTL